MSRFPQRLWVWANSKGISAIPEPDRMHTEHYISVREHEAICRVILDERNLLRENLLETYVQGVGGLGPDGKYDHMCISSWESLQDDLIRWGLLKSEECSRK